MQISDYIFGSDLHLDGYETLFPDATDPNEYVFRVLNQMTAYARANSVPHIVIPGDIFDTPTPSARAQMALLQFFAGNPDLNFWMILGNHDCANNNEHSLEMLNFLNKELALCPNVTCFVEPTLFNIDDFEFSFLPWPHRTPLSDRPHIVVAHIDVAGAVRPSGRSVTQKNDTVAADADNFWLIGHIHKPQIIGKNRNIVYVGSLLQKNFGETGARYFSHVRCVSDGRRFDRKIKQVPITLPYQLFNITINSIDDLATIKILPSDGKSKNLYKVWCAKDLVLPPRFLSDYPNVVAIETINSGGHKTNDVNDLMTPEWIDLDVRSTIMDDTRMFLEGRQTAPDVAQSALSILTGIMSSNVIAP